MTGSTPVAELREASKYFGSIVALDRVSMFVMPGEILCLLGDNGAGKSTLIKILAGVHRPDAGTLLVNGSVAEFGSPRDSIAAGIATVYQDLALFPLMSITRNFVAGIEPSRARGMLAPIDLRSAEDMARRTLREIGIDIRDPSELVGSLSGGERQSLAIARAEHIGARLLILDEPTSALGVKEAAIVLRHVIRARSRGLAIIFITHNAHHAYAVADRFVFLNRGRVSGTSDRASLSLDEMTHMMGGGEEIEGLARELEGLRAAGDASESRA